MEKDTTCKKQALQMCLRKNQKFTLANVLFNEGGGEVFKQSTGFMPSNIKALSYIFVI